MTSILILAVICILIGLYAIIKGDMPLIRKKDIRDVKMYARINGAAGIASVSYTHLTLPTIA